MAWPFTDPAEEADLERTYHAEPWPALDGLGERHLRLIRALWRCKVPGKDNLAHAKHATLAEMVGLKGEPRPGRQAQGSRQVRQLMAELYRRGLVVPHPYEQRGRVAGPSGGERNGARYYTLNVRVEALPPPPSANGQVAPLGDGNGAGRTARRRAARTPASAEAPQTRRPDAKSPGRTARTRTREDKALVTPLGDESPSPSNELRPTQNLPDHGEHLSGKNGNPGGARVYRCDTCGQRSAPTLHDLTNFPHRDCGGRGWTEVTS